MSRKRYTPEQIISMLREAEVGLAQGDNDNASMPPGTRLRRSHNVAMI